VSIKKDLKIVIHPTFPRLAFDPAPTFETVTIPPRSFNWGLGSFEPFRFAFTAEPFADCKVLIVTHPSITP